MKTSDIEKIVYFQDYVVTDPGKTPLKKKQLLTEDEYRGAAKNTATNSRPSMGAEAIKKLLGMLDLVKLSEAAKKSAATSRRPTASRRSRT
jgi:DNA-directed RNA polymerase subunit beta'